MLADIDHKVTQFAALDARAAGVLLDTIAKGGRFTPPMDMRRRIREVEHLPPLPDTSRQLLQLAADDTAGAAELGALVERDPVLAAQIIRWARSPLYGFRGEINSVPEAIARVLGFDLVLNIALGLSALEPLKIPADGPLGLRAYWKHAVYTAALVSRLADMLAPAQRPPRGQAYLCGLLHNLGFLLLGHLFPREFDYLNLMVTANPDLPVVRLERFAFGVDHCQLGAWLTESWDLPEAVSRVLVEHHNPYYQGDHQTLVRLVAISDLLLAGRSLGDVSNPALPFDVLDDLGLAQEDIDRIMEFVDEKESELDNFARQLAG